MREIFLASKSPRRNEILKKAGINFSIIQSNYEEELENKNFSYEKIENLAKGKAQGATPYTNSGFIIGADTVVVLDNLILTKPKDREDAFNILKSLSNKTHNVVTSVCVYDVETQKYIIESTTTEVIFENLTDEKINYYINKFKPFDKAGAYGIQEMPRGYIKAVNGDLENVIGIASKSVIKCINELTSILSV